MKQKATYPRLAVRELKSKAGSLKPEPLFITFGDTVSIGVRPEKPKTTSRS